MNKALFLDRDGIFNQVVFRNGAMHSPTTWEEIVHYPGLEELPRLKKLGYLLVLITNQPDIERKILTQEFVEEVNAFYLNRYQLDKAYYCPFSSNAHPDKKPNPGMFLRAAQELKIDLSRSFHLGDTDRDLLAAERCGATPILWEREYNTQLYAQWKVRSLEEVRAVLVARASHG